MHSEHQPIERCRDCGCVSRVLIHEWGIGDDGVRYQVVRGEQVPHSRRDCEAFQRLEKETWPVLPF